MDDIDRAILNRIQSDFPITSRPYLAVAEELGLSEEIIIGRVSELKKKGIIRRIGGNLVPARLGYVSTLCAAKVSPDKLEAFIQIVNRYPGVTHNYERDHEFNVWFTFIERSMSVIEENLKKIAEASGVSDILNLPSTQVFKLKAKFDLE